jgi:hypothetical protein
MHYIKYLTIFLILFFSKTSIAFEQSEHPNNLNKKGIQLSLLTCGPGAEIYSTFGHTAIRVVDYQMRTDVVYNYGTFDGFTENFELKFMRGQLLYYLSKDDFDRFMYLYAEDGRWVSEQIISGDQVYLKKIVAALETNYLPENKFYKYDFFFDNCATRIRDIFRKADPNLQLGEVIETAKNPTFRQIINYYLSHNQWERLGINILLGSKIDRKMTNDDIQFLPDYLKSSVGLATTQKENTSIPFVQSDSLLLRNEYIPATITITPNFVLYSLLFIVIITLFFKKARILSNGITNLFYILTGLLGVLILIMWFWTDHKGCANNTNLLWALPTNLLIPFIKKPKTFLTINTLGIVIALSLHFIGIQGLLIPEFLALLGILMIANISKLKQIQLSNI